MAIKKCCENCNAEYNDYEYCPKCKYNQFNTSEYDFDLFTPNEKAIREDEKEKFITLLKSDLENFDGLADECVERKDIHELLENNAVRKYIESTIELLEKN